MWVSDGVWFVPSSPIGLVVLHTLILLRLTSVKELSLLFILCRVSSTLVGLGGSSNTGFIFSPLITSGNQTQDGVNVRILSGLLK